MSTSTRSKPASIDDYLVSIPDDARVILEDIRRLIAEKVPDATETIAYQMPAFRLGNVFIYFAAFKKHIGIYPPVHGDKALQKALTPYRGDNGNLKFPLSAPMPYELISRVVIALAQQYGKQQKSR